ncbi:MAG: tRNA (adenosine(37)-N6)-dimethylallyltransferase, partial [Dehalococcoidia bacterium]
GQYIWALAEGWQVPRVGPDTELRVELEARARVYGAAALHDELARLDPVAAAAIHPNNVRRVIRALELFRVTGELPSRLRTRRGEAPAARIVGLSLPRELLYERIDRRVDLMIVQGLVEEVQSLLRLGYSPSLPSMSGIGYAQVVQYLRGEFDLGSARERIKIATHRLARQQRTWFRRNDPRIRWLVPGDVAVAVGYVKSSSDE